MSLLDQTAILVLGARRPVLLGNTLESLRRQGVMHRVHVWLDGHQGFREHYPLAVQCRQMAERFQPARLVACQGRYGIDRLIQDALTTICADYDAVIVLEDDCFPTRSAIVQFLDSLASIAQDESVFSVYGHPFLVPGEGPGFPRFQGWGWAAWTRRLLPILTAAKSAHAMVESDMMRWMADLLTPEVRRRLAVTPGRDPVKVAEAFYSWDACFAVLTASLRLSHLATPRRVVYNCGMGPDSGHFSYHDSLRLPPYNMIAPDEVWKVFDDSPEDIMKPGL